MSAWIVGKTHIDLLVTAGLFYGATSRSPDDLGQMLWSTNLDSVAYRYPDDTDGTRPGPIGFCDSDVLTYTFTPVPGVHGLPRDLAVVANCLACYEHQSCEHPDWETSKANAFCSKLRSRILWRFVELTGFRVGDLPWGFDDPTYLVKPAA